MLAFAIDRGDQLRKGHAALLGDLFQTVPELVFKADARLMACNDSRALRNQRLHGFSPANEPAVASCAYRTPGALTNRWSFQKFADRSGASAVYPAVDCRLRA